MNFVIGVDIGTGSTKAVLTTLDGGVQAIARRDHAPSDPQPGWAEMNPERDWWGDVAEVLTELTSAHPEADIAAVCVSGLGPCVVQR
jgi:xylulokinase